MQLFMLHLGTKAIVRYFRTGSTVISMAKITSKVQSLGYIVMDDCSGNILARINENIFQ
jgi:hypothetical protein